MGAARVRSAVPDAVVVRDAELIVIDLGSGVDPAEVVAIRPVGLERAPLR